MFDRRRDYGGIFRFPRKSLMKEVAVGAQISGAAFMEGAAMARSKNPIDADTKRRRPKPSSFFGDMTPRP
jgi:hypothetical protein